MTHDAFRYIDPRAERSLDDVGLIGHALVESVDCHGTVQLWVAACALINVCGADLGNESPTHERLGELPPHWASRVAHTPLRCGAPMQHGHRCRVRVHEPGTRCHHHNAATQERP